jgi:hypothetical protein
MSKANVEIIRRHYEIRHGKGDKRREVGRLELGTPAAVDRARTGMPAGRLFCIIDGSSRGRPSGSSIEGRVRAMTLIGSYVDRHGMIASVSMEATRQGSYLVVKERWRSPLQREGATVELDRLARQRPQWAECDVLLRGGQLRQSAEALLCGSVIRQVGEEALREPPGEPHARGSCTCLRRGSPGSRQTGARERAEWASGPRRRAPPGPPAADADLDFGARRMAAAASASGPRAQLAPTHAASQGLRHHLCRSQAGH